MADEENTDNNTDNQSKRYNTRPKRKTSFEVFESKYSNFYVDTSPKLTRRQKSQQNVDVVKQQRQMRAKMYSVGQQQGTYAHGSYYQPTKGQAGGFEMHNVAHYQQMGLDSGQNPMYLSKKAPGMPSNLQYMYNQPPYGVPPNYQGMYRPNMMQPTGNQPMVYKQMPYQVDPNRYRMPTPGYNPNTQFAMSTSSTPSSQTPTPHLQPKKYPGFPGPGPGSVPVPGQGPGPRPPYGFPNVNPNVLVSKSPQAPLQMQTSDNRQMMGVKMDVPKPGMPPDANLMMTKHVKFQEKPKQPGASVAGHPGHQQSDQIHSYFSAVDIIMKDISDNKKFETTSEKFNGRMSVPDSFDFPDFHKIVCFDYLVDDKLYDDILEFLKRSGKSKVEFPVNGTNPPSKDPSPKELVNDNFSTRAMCSEKTDTESPVEDFSKKRENEIQDMFGIQLIQLVREKKIFPITFESCKNLSFDELNPFFTLLSKSNYKVVNYSGLKKCRVKSVLSSQEDNKSHYLVFNNEEQDNNRNKNKDNYSLKYQFGCFFGNDFFNKRVPLFTSVEFGEVDPSFLLTRNMDRKKYLKSSLNYIKVYRSYDILVEKLNLYFTFELSKILVQSDKDLSNTKHQLSVYCSLDKVPKILSYIHFKPSK